MAYNSGYNPDALPAHAEPDQAAAMLAGQASGRPHAGSQSHNQGGSRPHAPSQSYSNPAVPGAYNKPQPPLPSRQSYPKHQLGAYAAGPGQQGGGYAQSPPPSNYGMTLPPQQHHNRPPPNSRPPATPVPPAGADPTLFPLFKTVDKGNTGQLTEKELGAALVNGDWSTFDPDTVRMMIKMFDTDRSGTIGFDEFCGLWGFLSAWRTLFDRFDADGSGNISYDEFTNALVAFGYRLSPQFVSLLFTVYDKRGENAISFDLFVQACITLKRMTDVFKKYDDDRDGYITLSFEEFLTEILRNR